MKLITKNSDYAIRAISYLSGKKKPAAVSEMSRELKIPGPFLRKILQILNAEGILSSNRGKNGGFTIAVPPDKIRLTDIMLIFQEPIKPGECLIKKNPCPELGNCLLRSRLNSIKMMVERELYSITLDTLIER